MQSKESSNNQKETFEKSIVLFDNYLKTVSDEEFLALYDKCETYEGITIDEWLKIAYL